ncbi:oligosaccharide flippase family protein [Erythrobacter sp. EC-HK427]|uniref:oligosaccharide flippase family protein n=1 Tax=Erythrobacter sp. EC-HK427 TaxID=2038396 RepID=UPI0018FE5E7D|nr:oligosaccharide flippase family protein [Erythrobacter sp. EC-HK427]
MRQYFIGGSAGLFVLRIISVVLGLGVSTILARELGAAEFGVFSFAIGVATLLSLPFCGGLPTLLIGEIAQARETGDAGKLRGVIRWGYLTQLILLLVFGGLAIGTYLVAVSLGVWWWNERETQIALLVLLIVPAMGFIHLQRGILVGFERPVLSGIGEQLIRPGAMLGLLLLFLAMLDTGSVGALWLQLGATLIAGVVIVALIRSVLPPAGDAEPEIRWKEWTLAMLPLTATTATTIVSNNTDILMLGILQPPEEAGVYRIAAQISVIAAILMQILRAIAAPQIAAAHARGDLALMRRLMVHTGWAATAAALGFVVVFAIFGEFALVLVFGPEYAASYWPCLVLALGSVLGASCTMVSIALQMTRNGGIVAKAAIVAAVFNVVLNLLLVPSFGALGAAIGTAVSLSVMQLQLAYQAQRILGVRADIFQMPSAR